MTELGELRAAVAALYTSPSCEERHAADLWLRRFTAQDGAWRLLLALLAEPAAADHERFFAVSSLRPSCQRQRTVVEPASLASLVPLLAQQFAAAAAAGCWHTGNQLAAVLATIAVRAPSWPEQQVLPQLLALVQGALHGSIISLSASSSSSSGEAQQLALLRLLAAVPEAACCRDLSMHPQRREAVKQALAAAPEPLAAMQQALAAPGSSLAVQTAALQLLQAWCGLGQPPAGAESSGPLWRLLHQAALQAEVGGAAAEAVATLYGSLQGGGCGGEGSCGSSCAAGSRQAGRQCQLLGLLLGLLPAFAAGLQQALAHAHGGQQARVLYAALAILSAAAKAADGQQDWGAGGGAAAASVEAVHVAAEVALVALHHPQLDVTLAALRHWDEQLERWQHQHQHQQQVHQQGAVATACAGYTPPSQQQQQEQQQQQYALLGRLCSALLQRMGLPADLQAGAATADARDLPEGVQLVRREVADTFRAASDCLGPQQTRQQLLQLTAEAQAGWQAAAGAAAAAAAAGGSGAAVAAAGGWQQLECCLYALNLVWGRQRGQQQRQQDAVAEVRQAAAAVAAALHPAAPKLAGTALTLLGGMAEQLQLLLLLDQQQVQLQQQQQQQHAQQTEAHQWQQQQTQLQQQEQQEQLLPGLLALLLQLVQLSGDEKLSRNAATCCYRLTSCRQLAAELARQHPSWGDALCSCFAAAGGIRQRARSGEDLASTQLLLMSICHLACAAAAAPPPVPAAVAAAQASHSRSNGSSSSSSILGTTSGVELLARLLDQPGAAARDALSAAAAAAGGSEQQLHHLAQAAVHVETIALALEAVTGAGGSTVAGASSRNSSSLAEQLPSLLGSLGDVLQRAAAAAAAAAAACAGQQPQAKPGQQQHVLLQAVCRVAAAAVATPAASTGLGLLQPFVAAAPHPCVLLTLAELAAAAGCHVANNSGGSGGSGGAGSYLQQLQAAASSSIRAAAAQHSGDADWQPALLLLGAACLRQQTQVAAEGATLDALLCAAQHGMSSYHRDVCEQVLHFTEALCCIGCQQQAGAPAGADTPAQPGGTRGAPAAGAGAAAAAQHLRQRLDAGGLGSALLLGLLLAAAGSMPPYMVIQLADAMHRTWQAVGSDRFAAWLEDAALRRAPDGAPWRRWKQEAQVAALADLLSPQCAQDSRRFKRLLKVFCGGKKKGQHVDQPARASNAIAS